MRALICFKILSGLFFLLATQALAAGNERIYGPEFTFTNAELVEAFEEKGYIPVDSAMKDLAQKIHKICSGRAASAANACHVTTIDEGPYRPIRYEIEYPNVSTGKGKLKITVATDPYVIEAQVTPMTLKEWEANASIVQHDLFDVAASQRLVATAEEGGGHLNIGYTYFSEKPDLFVAFNVDVANHPELSMGGFGAHDQEDAVALAELNPDQRKKYAQILSDYHSGKIKTPEQFADRVNREVNTFNQFKDMDSPKYHALNVTTVPETSLPIDERRIEFRPVSAQKDVKEFIRDARLVDKRIEFLEKRLAEGKFPEFFDSGVNTTVLDTQDLATRFRTYVEESGLAWDGADGYAQRARVIWGASVDAAQPLTKISGCGKAADFFVALRKAL